MFSISILLTDVFGQHFTLIISYLYCAGLCRPLVRMGSIFFPDLTLLPEGVNEETDARSSHLSVEYNFMQISTGSIRLFISFIKGDILL